MAEMFPMFVNLEGRDVLVVGAGEVAARKIESLKRAGAKVRVVALEICDKVRAMEGLELQRRAWERGDVGNAVLVVSATGDPEVNRQVAAAARQSGALVNAVDDPPNCDYYVPAIVRDGDLRIAISTQGKAPLLAGAVRKHLEEKLPGGLGELVEAVSLERRRIMNDHPDEPTRLAKLREFLDAELRRRGIDL